MSSSGTRKPVHLAVYDTLADWETGHTTAHLARAGYGIRTVGPTRGPVVSIGGLRVEPDLALADVRPEDSSLLILPGADLWDTGTTSPPSPVRHGSSSTPVSPSPRSAGRPPGSRARGCWTTGTTPARSPSTWRPPGTAAANGTSTRTR